jgi:isopentenyl-diphosphate delta-isomerase
LIRTFFILASPPATVAQRDNAKKIMMVDTPKVEYKKSSVILVFNSIGELALQLRAEKDTSFPSHWDFSAGGGVDPGEDSALTARRELQEELGVEAEVEFVGEEHFSYPAWNPGVLREVDVLVFKAHHDGPFTPDPNEVEEVRFFSLETIGDMITSGKKFHPEFAVLWNKGIISRAANAR